VGPGGSEQFTNFSCCNEHNITNIILKKIVTPKRLNQTLLLIIGTKSFSEQSRYERAAALIKEQVPSVLQAFRTAYTSKKGNISGRHRCMTRIVPVATVTPLVLNAIEFDTETAGSTALTDETVHLERGKTGARDQAEAGVRGGENGS